MNINAFCRGATISNSTNVGLEHIWKGGTLSLREVGGSISLLLCALEVDVCAVHVHFSVANLVVPGPGQSVLARWKVWVIWNRELKCSRPSSAGIIGKVSSSVGRASTFNRMNNHPFRAGADCQSFRKGDLARATTMSSTTSETESLRHPYVDLVDTSLADIKCTFARIIRTIGSKW